MHGLNRAVSVTSDSVSALLARATVPLDLYVAARRDSEVLNVVVVIGVAGHHLVVKSHRAKPF